MPERSRYVSPHSPAGHSPRSLPDTASLPLTEENLNLFDRSQPGPLPLPSAPVSLSQRENSNLDDRTKLPAYNIRIQDTDNNVHLPPSLQQFVSDRVIRARNVEASPATKRVMERSQRAAQMNEVSAIHFVLPHLLAGLHGKEEGGLAYLKLQLKVKLSRSWLPKDDHAKSLFGELSQPEPDIAVGYNVKWHLQPPVKAAFAQSEEMHLFQRCLSPYLHFPFLTLQWKSPSGSESMMHARWQSARDGATIVNYVHDHFHHFSITTDVMHTNLFIHWRESGQDDQGKPIIIRYMKSLHESSLQDKAGVEQIQNIINNIAAWAMGDRLDGIREALSRSIQTGTWPKASKPATLVSGTEPASSESETLPHRPQRAREKKRQRSGGSIVKKVKCEMVRERRHLGIL